MDPNTTLKDIRGLVEKWKTNLGLAEYEADLLTEYIAALDEWLSYGGFLPQAWEQKQ